ncbi:unnamed protein product [Orchesella dallaii]|uniref:Kazal-like domain-containing protein n=1 Tax=Orchesella dallaii TaxID=48710 RepID=A0ABP1Q5N9_9HEXA
MKFFLQVAITTVLIYLATSIKEATSTNRTEAELSLIEALESSLSTSPYHNATMTKPLKAVSESILQSNATTVNAKRTCACDDTEETPVCASNGVTYKNGCRFECAKARVNRLRQIKQGRCSQTTGASSYWQSKKSG